MSPKSEAIFIKVRNADEKQQILEDIVKHHRGTVIKSNLAGGEILPVEPISLLRNQLTCRLPKSDPSFNGLTEAILQFSVGTEKYLALCSCHLTENTVVLNLDTDIFKIQRREDFRLKLPSSYQAFFHFRLINGKLLEIEFPLIDLSAGGCRIESNKNSTQFKKNDQVTGKIVLSKRQEIPIAATIVHVAKGSTGENSILLGLQFTNISSVAKDRLVGIVMDLYKELFSRI